MRLIVALFRFWILF
uniref:Uncharacterized protein n=1 Tax=Arundo donax TaxID=35708 RepID=A0A0A9B8U7_ARUDO